MKFFILSLLILCSYTVSASVPEGRHIVIEGQAKVSAVPDIVVIYLNVEAKEKASASAKNDVDSRVNKFLDGLNAFGISDKNVSASNISTQPSYFYVDNKEVLDGYTASRSVKVTLGQVERLNELLNFALSVEINQIQNIEFESSLKASLQKEAVSLAVENAKTQGRIMAEAFDANLGKVYSINSLNQGLQHRYGFNDRLEKIMVTGSRIRDDAFEPGRYLQENIVFSASVHVVFDLSVE